MTGALPGPGAGLAPAPWPRTFPLQPPSPSAPSPRGACRCAGRPARPLPNTAPIDLPPPPFPFAAAVFSLSRHYCWFYFFCCCFFKHITCRVDVARGSCRGGAESANECGISSSSFCHSLHLPCCFQRTINMSTSIAVHWDFGSSACLDVPPVKWECRTPAPRCDARFH